MPAINEPMCVDIRSDVARNTDQTTKLLRQLEISLEALETRLQPIINHHIGTELIKSNGKETTAYECELVEIFKSHHNMINVMETKVSSLLTKLAI